MTYIDYFMEIFGFKRVDEAVDNENNTGDIDEETLDSCRERLKNIHTATSVNIDEI